MSDKEFYELYNSYTGEGGMFSGIDNPKQLTVNMTGEELKEWTEFAIQQANGVNTDNSGLHLPLVSGSLPLTEVQDLIKEAKELVVRLLPPIDYGENQYADRLYEILETIEGVKQ